MRWSPRPEGVQEKKTDESVTKDEGDPVGKVEHVQAVTHTYTSTQKATPWGTEQLRQPRGKKDLT